MVILIPLLLLVPLKWPHYLYILGDVFLSTFFWSDASSCNLLVLGSWGRMIRSNYAVHMVSHSRYGTASAAVWLNDFPSSKHQKRKSTAEQLSATLQLPAALVTISGLFSRYLVSSSLCLVRISTISHPSRDTCSLTPAGTWSCSRYQTRYRLRFLCMCTYDEAECID